MFVTGLGAVSPLGVGVAASTAAWRAGRSGVRPLAFSHPRVKSRVAADVGPDRFDAGSALSEADLRRVPRLVPMALTAAREALRHAGLAAVNEAGAGIRERFGVVLGTGGGGIDFTLDQFHNALNDRPASLWTITNATHGNLAGELSIRLGLQGPSLCVSTGCASSSDALGQALMMIRHGAGVDAMVVVGADAHLRWETLSSMELLGVMSTSDVTAVGDDPATTSRPFDARRDGFVLGEGAWAMVLESDESIARRTKSGAGARPGSSGPVKLAQLAGYAATCDAFHRVRPMPDMAQATRAITAAIVDAGLTSEQIGVVHYHGTATKINDSLETRAVKAAFGPHAGRLAGHSIKSAIGHPQGAAGIAAAVSTLAALLGADGGGAFLPPTLHLTTPDPECDLNYTPNQPRPVPLGRWSARIEPGGSAPASGALLVNCLAFGAKNSALVFTPA